MQRRREKGENVKEKEERGKKKEERGKEMRKGDVKGYNNCRIGKKLGKKATIGVKKLRVARGGKNIIFRRVGGINIVFGPKYIPLLNLYFYL